MILIPSSIRNEMEAKFFPSELNRNMKFILTLIFKKFYHD